MEVEVFSVFIQYWMSFIYEASEFEWTHTHTLDTYSHILATPLHTLFVYGFISTDK